jgi:hypothetical protein
MLGNCSATKSPLSPFERSRDRGYASAPLFAVSPRSVGFAIDYCEYHNVDFQKTATRSELVSAIRERLRRVSLPRFQMLIIVMVTGLSGFLASVVLLRWNLRVMWLRYDVCAALAYLIFLLLHKLWIHCRARFVPDVGDILDGPGTPDVIETRETSRPSESGALDWLDFFDVFDVDELLVLVAFLVAVASALIVSVYVVSSAPNLFAEVLVDAALTAGLYRRGRNLEPRHWLESILRLTGIPFAFVALFFIVAGGVSQVYAPEAVSIGGVLRHSSTPLRTSWSRNRWTDIQVTYRAVPVKREPMFVCAWRCAKWIDMPGDHGLHQAHPKRLQLNLSGSRQ